MSLHKFAEQVAANGRGDDSLLVHMTPDEVQRLQAFAEANGTTMTINPETGLPEAGFLSDLFKAVAPIALGAFLGPAGLAFGGPGLTAGMAGLATGGITALATGSLSRGLMAGLGAYGGAGIGANLMGAGTGAMSQAAGAGLSEEAAQQAVGAKLAAATPMETLTAGYNAATANPSAMGAFAKQNLGNIGYAAAPIMAGAMVPTTTKAPTSSNENYIRQFDFNINPETGKPDPLYGLRSMAPVKANEFGNKTFQGQRDLFRQQNPNPYELGVASLNQPPTQQQQQQQQPPRMNTGGIVALAGGGDYTTLTKDSSADDIASAYKQFTTAGGGDTAANQKAAVDYLTNLGIGQDKIGQAYGTYQASPTYTAYTEDQMGSFLSNPVNKDINLDKAILDTNANPADVNRYISNIAAPFVGSTDTTGGSGTLGIYNQMNAQGIDPNELYASRIAADPKYAGWSKEDIQRGYNLDKGALALAAAQPGGVSDKNWAKFMDDNKYSVNDMAQAFGLSKNEVQRRYDAAKAIEKKVVTPITTVTGTGINTGTNTSVVPDGYYGSGPATGVDYRGNTVSIATPGDIITNPDGTRTVAPNIPGRQPGGFTGIEELKSRYTAGGGSLGYTSRVPKTIEEFNTLYNKQTGDSLAAYNYLMGKGANPIKSSVSKLAVPYSEYALGKKTTGLKPITTTTVKGVVGNPQTYFDEKAYLAANPDVAAELKSGKANFASGYAHWLANGQKEGRAFTGDYAGYKTAAAAGDTYDGSTNLTTVPMADGGITGNGQLNLNIPLNLGGAGGANGYNAMGGGFGSAGGYQTQSNQNSVQQSGMPDFRNQMQGFDAQIQKLPSITAYNDYTKSISGRPPTADEMAQVEQLRKGIMGDQGFMDLQSQMQGVSNKYQQQAMSSQSPGLQQRYAQQSPAITKFAEGGYAVGGGLGSLGSYSDGGRLLKGPGDGVSDSIPATIGAKGQPARLADGEFVIPARIVSELGNGSTDAGAKKLYAMMDRVQRARGKTTGKNKVAANSRSDKYLPA